MPEMPFYNKNEPKGEWPGGSTGCAKFSLPEVSVFLLDRELKFCITSFLARIKRQAWQSWRWRNVAQW